MYSRRLVFVAASAVILAFSGGLAPVQAVVLEATTDVWIREAGPDATFESDLMSVWSSFGNDGARRYGALEFDVSSLSGVTVDFAFLSLWGDDNGFSDDSKPIKQSAVAVDTTGGTQVADFTWNVYQNEYAAGATTLEGLGSFDLEFPSPPPSQFYNSMGSVADRVLIETTASGAGGGNQLLSLVMIADELDMVDYAHSWGDGPDGFGGMNARLYINEVPPENQDFQLQVNTTTGAMSIVNPAVLTTFDFDGYVIQSAEGSLDPVGWNSLEDQGMAGWQEVAPSVNALSELNLTMQSQLLAGESASLGNAFTVGGMEDLTFEYSIPGFGTKSGAVTYVTGGGPDCDLDGSGSCGLDDIDRLYDEIFAGTNNPAFDFNGDNVVDNDDIEGWLAEAGTENGETYKPGDTNLDGDVGGTDFTTLAFNFGNGGADPTTVDAYFRHGNFDGNGTNNTFEVGGPDFTALAFNFGFTSPVSSVPEPAAGTLLLFGGLLLTRLARRRP